MSDQKLDVVRFNLEVELPEVPQQLVDFAKLIKDDQSAPIRERQLAQLIIELAKCIDRLTRSLESSKLALHVTDRDAKPFRQ